MQVPSSVLGLIGGSSTLSIDFPEVLAMKYVQVEERDLIFDTPFGPSPAFKCLQIDDGAGGRRVLTCSMHGWRSGVSRADASRQVFWVFREAGVKTVLAEGGVGAINHLLKPRDLLIPHDYMDFSMRKDVHLGDGYLLVMRNAFCSDLRQALLQVCNQNWQDGRIFDRGIYVNTDGRHFESPAEVQYFKQGGADVVGQSICPEVYLAREIGACYAGLYMVVNYAEGIVSPWQHEELALIFHEQSRAVGRILCQTMRDLPLDRACGCAALRKETLLSEVYSGE